MCTSYSLDIELKKFLTFLLISAFQLGISATAMSQNAEISGTVIDNESNPLVNATVALYEPGGDEILEGTATSVSGEFRLEIEPGTYNMEITYVSFQTYSLTAGETLNLQQVQLEPTQESLGDVEVQGQRSYMEMNFDSRSFNVEEDITSLGGSALDVLDNVPSISTDFEGNVSLRGNQGVQILINGRPSNLVRNGTDALSSIPASMIEEVKIITNPSARYSADGTAGIIDIILVDDARLGFNGSVRVNAGYPQDYGIGANFNFQRNKVNWFLNTELEYENQPETGRTFQSFSSDTTYAYSERSETDEIEREGNINFGADIFLPFEQILTIESRINLENEVEDRLSRYSDYNIPNDEIYRSINESWGVSQRTIREIYEDQRESDFDIRAQYEKTFKDNPDHQLVADLDFEFGEENGNTEFDQVIEAGSGDELQQRSFSGEIYREVRMDIDYEQPIGEGGRFEGGLRFNYDWEDSDYRIEELRNENWVNSPQNVGGAENFIYLCRKYTDRNRTG